MKPIYSLLFSLVFSAGCTMAEKKKEVVEGFPAAPSPATSADSEAISVDYPALQRAMQMDRSRESLGFSEKSFNTCEVGYGYSSSKACRKENLVVIHFRLLCRDSEGTVSTILTDQDTQALDRRSVRWSLKGLQGVVQTDSDGYGQILAAGPSSQKSQRIRLGLGSEFLYMRTNEIKKIITPQTWCNQY